MSHADVRSTRFWRAVLTIFALAVVAAVLLVGCSDARSSSSSGSTTVSGASQGQGAPSPDLVSRARVFLAERSPIPGWNRGVVLRTMIDGPAEHRRWTAAVMNGGGRIVPIDSCHGETDDVAVLVDVGDYVRFRTEFGCVDAPGGPEHRTVIEPIEKGAVKP